MARRIARAIVRRANEAPIETTARLAEVDAQREEAQPHEIDPSTLTFQALRIAANEELVGLDQFVDDAVSVLEPGARIAHHLVPLAGGSDRQARVPEARRGVHLSARTCRCAGAARRRSWRSLTGTAGDCFRGRNRIEIRGRAARSCGSRRSRSCEASQVGSLEESRSQEARVKVGEGLGVCAVRELGRGGAWGVGVCGWFSGRACRQIFTLVRLAPRSSTVHVHAEKSDRKHPHRPGARPPALP